MIKDSEGPLVGASIQILEIEKGIVSGPDGKFEFNDIPCGEYTIEIRSIGAKTQKIPINVNVGASDLGSIQLEQSSIGLKEVVVTGSLKPESISNSPVKVELVTAKQFETYLPSGGTNLVEGISLVNGVQEEVACGVCFTNSISINGLPGQYTSILMDGTPMFGNLASVYGLNGIPTMMVDRIEVIKGPNSTLYGSEAVAGVINVITKDPAKQPSLTLDIMGSSHQEIFTNLGLSTKVGNSTGFLGVNHGRSNLYEDRNEDGFGDLINMDRYSLLTKWNISRPSKKAFSIAGKYYFEDRRNGTEAYLRDQTYKSIRGDSLIYGESIYTARAEVFGSYHFNTKEAIRIDYSASHHSQDSYYGSDYYAAIQNILFGNLIWTKTLGRNDLTIGYTNRMQFYDDNTVATENEFGSGSYNGKGQTQFIPGIFAQDEFKASASTTILAGARLDHYQAHGLIFSPRLSTKQDLGKWTSLRANFGTGFRVVNLFTEDHAFITGQREVHIAPNLMPERSLNFSLNLNHVFVMGSSQGMLDFDGFYTHFFNKINPDYSDPGKIIYENSIGYATSKGLGLRWVQEFDFPLALSLAGTFMEVSRTSNGQKEALEFAPNFTGVAMINYEFKKLKLNISYSSNWTGVMALPEVYDLDQNGEPFSQPRSTRSRPFSLHNIKLEKAMGNSFFLYGGVMNLFDYYQPVSPLVGFNDPNSNPGFSEYFDTSYSYSPIHGREVYLGVRLNLGMKNP